MRISPFVMDKLLKKYPIPVMDCYKRKFTRVCDRIEKAHWEYLDNFCSMDEIRHQKLVDFAYCVFNHVSFLKKEIGNLKTIFREWGEYNRRIPRYGAILVSDDEKHVLLVKSFKRGLWCFPRGKHEGTESPEDCAVREVMEETGFDIRSKLNEKEWVEHIDDGQRCRLYIIRNVSREVKMIPRTNHEIECCQWFDIRDLVDSVNHWRGSVYNFRSDELKFIRPYLKEIENIYKNPS